MKTEEIIKIFIEEFKGLNPQNKFIIFKMKYVNADNVRALEIWDWNNDEWLYIEDTNFINSYIWHPGTYLFWRNEEVIRVGRALDNARKRALVYRNDLLKIKEVHDYIYKDLENTILILFSLKEKKDKHWGAALEIFFDLHSDIKPMLKSKRLG